MKTPSIETPKKKILIFAHAVTMAHFTRPLRLIEELDPAKYDIYLASDISFKKYSDGKPVTFIGIKCLDADRFGKNVVNAQPFYDAKTFQEHVEEDLDVINAVQPDVVVGDFRHSLSVSCRIKKIKYLNLTNAYWSSRITTKPPLPETPVVRKFGEKLASIFVAPFVPMGLKINFFIMAFMLRNQFRRAGFKIWDYRQVITDGDIAIYCDTEKLVPIENKQPRERFVGPLTWSMKTPLPDWWSKLDPKKKKVLLTLGSSGPAESLPLIISSLAKLDADVIIALAGKKLELASYKNVYVTNYLPLSEACEVSDLVICNGGSPVCHSALMFGIPTIGIVCNNDQLLNMAHISERGAGIMLRYWNLTEEKILNSVQAMLETDRYTQQAKIIQKEFESTNAAKTIVSIIAEVLKQS